ncbi:hypothetical protein AX15_004290 [Amanita polypyramis BW_CC]|nr:hypothetical protein AX15_004290 [Amanita polypyramis BW_CC]
MGLWIIRAFSIRLLESIICVVEVEQKILMLQTIWLSYPCRLPPHTVKWCRSLSKNPPYYVIGINVTDVHSTIMVLNCVYCISKSLLSTQFSRPSNTRCLAR